MKSIKKTKVCVKCSKRRKKECFYKQAATKDGYGSWCKSCSNEYVKKKNRERYLNDPESFFLAAADWKKENYERWYELNKKYQYAWREKNKEKYRAYMKVKCAEYYQKNKEAILAKAKKDYQMKKGK